jgi:molecular chaperone HscC
MNTIGIDFGTGNTALAEWYGAQSKIFEKAGNNGLVCSDIAVNQQGYINPRPVQELQNLQNYKIEKFIKRRLLNAIESEDRDAITYLTELATYRLKYIFDRYTNAATEKVVKAVLTCPANTGQAYRAVLMEIGRQIGLPSIDIVDEPTAAAVYHGLSETASNNERWMVIDWGCGTCDISMIERKQGSKDLKVVSVVGNNNLGGSDIDYLLGEEIGKKYGRDLKDFNLYSIEEIKIALSSKEEYEEDITLNDGTIITAKYSRSELEKLINPLLEQFKTLIDKALIAAKWQDSGVDKIIATGGPILMPSVKAIIKEIADDSGADLYDSDPLTSVAKGAARLAEIKRLGGLVVTNKVAKSIGVKVVNDKNTDAYHKVIVRGEDRPVTRQVELATSVDLQDIIEIEIREGDNDISASSNTLLAKLNAVVRPESKGHIKIKLQIALNDSGTLEAYIEPISDKSAVREIKAEGIRLEKGQMETATGELRTEDPVNEFKLQAIEAEVDPDTARQIYERLKVKYHPDRQPDKREYWNGKLRELDEYFNEYMLEIEKRMHASSVPNLPWNNPEKLEIIIIDEVLANRITHCLANNIGSPEQIKIMPGLLKKYPDYRRIVASYLFGVKRNRVLQKLLAEDDRPQVGMVVLLQNVQGKSIKERHEVLKAVYRVKEDKIRTFLNDENLDINKLYEEVPKVAEEAKNPMTRRGRDAHKTVQSRDGSIKLTYERDWTWIYGVPLNSPHAQKIKSAGFRWSGKRQAWFATERVDSKVFD